MWLGSAVLRSAVSVTRLAWAPHIPLRPVVESTPVPPMSGMAQVTCANSITFTPGTLALDLEDDAIAVHSLVPENVAQLRTGGMLRRVQRLENRS